MRFLKNEYDAQDTIFIFSTYRNLPRSNPIKTNGSCIVNQVTPIIFTVTLLPATLCRMSNSIAVYPHKKRSRFVS